MSVVWERLARRARAAASARPAPELHAHLPRLWPEGPRGPLDEDALRALSREYARNGRTLEELFDDIDVLCGVVGIGAPSRVLEASGVAWSDAFLGTVDPGAVAPGPVEAGADAEDLQEVEEQLLAHGNVAWTDLPPGRLLVLTVSSGRPPGGSGPQAEELAVLAAEVRRLFPRSAVAVQTRQGRVLGAVVESADLDQRLTRLRAFCSERTRASVLIEARAVPAEPAAVHDLLRPAG